MTNDRTITHLELLGDQVPFANEKFTDDYVNTWWETYSKDLTTKLVMKGFVQVDAIHLNQYGLWEADLSCEDIEWTDPLTDLTHYTSREWRISVNSLNMGRLGLMNPTAEHDLPIEVWQSRSTSRALKLGNVPKFIGDCYKECRMYPTLSLREQVGFLTGLRTDETISKAQFKSAFENLVYEVQCCN